MSIFFTSILGFLGYHQIFFIVESTKLDRFYFFEAIREDLLKRIYFSFIYSRKQDGVYLSGIKMVVLSSIQMALKNQTIWHPTSFQPLEYQTSLVFRSPMYYLCQSSIFDLLLGLYHNPKRGFKPGSSSECLLEFDTRSKPHGHHSWLPSLVEVVQKFEQVVEQSSCRT